jgi:hypothetical protein
VIREDLLRARDIALVPPLVIGLVPAEAEEGVAKRIEGIQDPVDVLLVALVVNGATQLAQVDSRNVELVGVRPRHIGSVLLQQSDQNRQCVLCPLVEPLPPGIELV